MTTHHQARLRALLPDATTFDAVCAIIDEAVQEAEQARDAQCRALLSASQEATLIYQDGAIVYANHAAHHLLLVPLLSGLNGRPLAELIHGEDRAALMAWLDAPTISGGDSTRAVRLLRADATTLAANLTAIPRTHAGRPALALLLHAVDEQPSMDQAYETLVKSALQGVVIVQGDRYVFTNPAFAEITGYTIEELLAMPADDVKALIYPDDRPAVRDYIIARASGQPEPVYSEHRLLRKDGTYAWVQAFASVIYYRGRRAFEVTYVDIADRKAAEAALAASEARYRAVVENQVDIIIRVTPEITFSFVNAAACDHYGYPREELLGASLFDIIPPRGHPQIYENLARLSPETPVRSHEHTVIRSSGEIRWQQWTDEALYDDSGRLIEYQCIARDITASKRTEAELRRAAASLRAILDSGSQGFTLIDTDRRIMLINRIGAAEAELVFGQRAAPGASIYDYVRPADRAAFDQNFARALGGESVIVEKRFPDQAGNARFYEMRYYPARDDDGLIIGVCLSSEDVTSRRWAEAETRRQAQLLEDISDAVIATDMDLRVESWNPAAERIYGWTAREAIGQQVNELLQTASRDREIEEMQRLVTTGHWSGEVVHATRNGARLDVLAAVSLIRDATGQPTGLVAVNRDITDQKATEHARRESDLLFRQIAENVREVFFVLDIPSQQMLYVNPSYERVFGQPVADLYLNGYAFLDAVHPDDLDQVRHTQFDWLTGGTEAALAALREMAAGQTVYDHEYRIVRPNGDVGWIWSRAFPVITPDEPVTRIVGLAEDTTQRHQAHQQALDLAMERERTRILANFIRDASHEFRTPLTVIETDGFLLRQYIQADEGHRLLDRIAHQGEIILKLLEALITMSKLDSGVDFVFQPVAINEIVERLVSFTLRSEIRARDLNVSREVPGQLVIEADSQYLNLAFIQVLRNAVSHSPPAGTITITAEREDGFVLLSVRDEGPGMDAATRDRVFERFYRGDEAHTTDGFGLGLPITQSIIASHGGTIVIESRPGEGTTVFIRLPASRGTAGG